MAMATGTAAVEATGYINIDGNVNNGQQHNNQPTTGAANADGCSGGDGDSNGSSSGEDNTGNSASEVLSKMIFMGHQISSCHVPVGRSFLSSGKLCYHLENVHMTTFQYILISPSSIPKSDLVLTHNSSCYDPNINFSCPKKSHRYVP